MKINMGKVVDGEYVKEVLFSKAVLWMKKELSVQAVVIRKLQADGIKTMRFIDKKKNEVWVFNTDEVVARGSFKQYGQEQQFYFPIILAKKEPYAAEKTTE